MYRRIMVVIGDQSWSDTPVKYAIALAAETGAELSILMVLTPRSSLACQTSRRVRSSCRVSWPRAKPCWQTSGS